MDSLSAYQMMRRANLKENNKFLMQYGLHAPVVEHTSVTAVEDPKRKEASKRVEKSQPSKKDRSDERRSSFRIRLKHNSFKEDESLKGSDEEEDEILLKTLRQPNRNLARPPRPNSYGSIEGVQVGTWWETRLDCCYDYIHRLTVAGIHQGSDGAYSVALSGGYEDDVDEGDFFTYTGEGGRDLKGTAGNPKNLRTAPQSKNQTLTRGNLALSRNVETGNPVRVIRGYKLRSKFAPERGYRYDGLYNVTKCWETHGKAGYKIFKFEFQRCDPEPAPWHEKTTSLKDENYSPIKSQENDENCNQTPVKVKVTRNLSSNPKISLNNEPLVNSGKDSRKLMYFELTPGKMSPIKVSNSLPTLRKFSISCENSGWLGWPDKFQLPQASCFIIKCGDEVEQVCLTGDQWCRMADLPTELSAPTVSCDPTAEGNELSNTSAVIFGAVDSLRIKSNKVKAQLDFNRHSRANKEESWCGWQKEDVIKCTCLTVSYGGCTVRVCEEGETWQELNHNNFSNVVGTDCEKNHEDPYMDSFEECFDWPGWPESEFSVLNCPAIFNCNLIDRI